ncbi:uncharacterized protein ACO6RY_16333 [Pungitius sinensis]
MSKLERLNARVAKLLTEAVHEVLGVVKETVSEYQEKTARTLRENESLKRKLHELQDELTRSSIAALRTSSLSPQERRDAPSQERDLMLALRQDPDLHLAEQKQVVSHQPVKDVKEELKPQEAYNNAEPQAGYNSAQTAERCVEHRHVVTRIIEDASTRANSGISAAAADMACASQCGPSLGLNPGIIKREYEPTGCAASEPSSLQRPFSGCVDLSCNSSRQNSAGTHRSQVGAAPHGRLIVHGKQATPRRHGFAKTNRAAFDGRRFRVEHFGGDDTHSCVVCGKTFSRVGNLRIHQRCHTGEKPYGCVLCGRRFSQAGDLKKHKRVHTGEKPYYCNRCGKSFSRGENLKRHQKIHVGEVLQLQ